MSQYLDTPSARLLHRSIIDETMDSVVDWCNSHGVRVGSHEFDLLRAVRRDFKAFAESLGESFDSIRHGRAAIFMESA